MTLRLILVALLQSTSARAAPLVQASPALTIIRMCQDNLNIQMYVFRDLTGALWYGSPSSGQLFHLDSAALDQVCPAAGSKPRGANA